MACKINSTRPSFNLSSEPVGLLAPETCLNIGGESCQEGIAIEHLIYPIKPDRKE